MWLSISYYKFNKEMLSVRRSWCTFILKTPSWSLSHTFYRSCWDLRIMKLYSDTLQPCTIPCNHNMLQASFIQYIWFVYFVVFWFFWWSLVDDLFLFFLYNNSTICIFILWLSSAEFPVRSCLNLVGDFYYL